MMNVTKPAANRVDITLRGSLNAEDMRDGLDQLIAVSQGVAQGLMFYEIKDFAMPTIGAFAVEMSRLPKLFGLLGKFKKCAVLSDIGWLRAAAEVEGKLLPGLELKSFAEADRDAAEAWLAA